MVEGLLKIKGCDPYHSKQNDSAAKQIGIGGGVGVGQVAKSCEIFSVVFFLTNHLIHTLCKL